MVDLIMSACMQLPIKIDTSSVGRMLVYRRRQWTNNIGNVGSMSRICWESNIIIHKRNCSGYCGPVMIFATYRVHNYVSVYVK